MTSPHAADYNNAPLSYAVDFDGNKLVGPSTPDANPTSWANVELRHFYGRDWSYFFYEKVCSSTQITQRWIDNRMKRLLEAFLFDVKVETETQHNELLRSFLFK